ncbi:MAG: hypothetical protein AMXMBFR66_00690 [Pseudomonadota bacterium]|nr:hypothetical protein [Comamonadaceae bacterium]
MRLLWLLLYSLAPGLAKLAGNDALFAVGLAALAAYFLALEPAPAGGNPDRPWVRLALLAFVAYGLALGAVLLGVGIADSRTMAVGTASFLIPLAMVALAGPWRARILLRDVPPIALVHALLALVIYPATRPDIGLLHRIGDPLLEGTFAFRLASVSGSLAFSVVMVVAFTVSLALHVQTSEGRRAAASWWLALLFLFCGFLSLQRAAWLALLLVWAVAVVLARGARRRTAAGVLGALLLPILVVPLAIGLPDYLEQTVADRFETLAGGSDSGLVEERADQWLNVLHNVHAMASGHGPGQIGQAVRERGPVTGGLPVFDGDYFRLVSEYGVAGLALTALMLAGAVGAVRRGVQAAHGQQPIVDALLATATIGLLAQALGTNVTELYFANTLFWALWLQMWGRDRTPPAPAATMRQQTLPRSADV